jgi:hypothetical protein
MTHAIKRLHFIIPGYIAPDTCKASALGSVSVRYRFKSFSEYLKLCCGLFLDFWGKLFKPRKHAP